MEFRPVKEGGKPDALTRRKADMPQEGDTRLTEKETILLPKEEYFDTRIQEMETITLKTNDEQEISKESAKDKEIQTIKEPLDTGNKGMKGVALGLCQWKDGYLWHQGKIWIRNNEGIRTNLDDDTTTFFRPAMVERLQLQHSAKENTIGQG